MAEDDRILAVGHDLERGACAEVRAVEHEADAVALLDDAPAEAGEARVGAIQDAVADVVAAVVGRDHHAQAQPVERLDAVQLPADEVAALREEQQRRASVPFRGPDVVDRRRDEQVGIPPGHEVPEHQLLGGLREVVVRLERGDAVGRHAVPVRDGEIGVGPHLHARVDDDVGVIPRERRVEAAVGARR